jgi:hypothetical protein
MQLKVKMKASELNKLMQAGANVLTGRFLHCKILETQTGIKYEGTAITGPKSNVEVKRWARKDDKAPLVPKYDKIPFGTPVVLLDFSSGMRDGYLQTDCTEIHVIEF